jgi:hypothetical protein
MKNQHVGVLLALLLLIGGVAVLPRLARAQAASVDPPSGSTGTEFSFAASGFLSREPVNYWVSLPDESVIGNPEYQVRANETGEAAWTWRAPNIAQPGFWLMVARGRESGIIRTVSFEVRGGGGNLATVDPPAGPPGTKFSFTVNGFDDDEEVGFWFNAPDGSVVGREDWRTGTDDDGEAEWVWRSPSDAPRGRWQMVARGKESNRQVLLFFELR